MKIYIFLVLLSINSVTYGNLFWNKKSAAEPAAETEILSVAVEGDGMLYLTHIASQETLSSDMKVENGVMKVHLKGGEKSSLYLKNLNSIQVNGNAVVKSDRQFNSQDFTINAGDDAKLFLPIEGKFVNVLVQDRAQVLLSGVVDEQHVIVQNKGIYEAVSLFTNIATVTVNGHGQAMVNVGTKLIADVSDDGLLRYGGDPSILKKNIQGAGKVERID